MTESPEDEKALLADPEIAASQATAQRRHIFTSKEQAGAIAFVGAELSRGGRATAATDQPDLGRMSIC